MATTVLVVDDHATFRRLARRLLEEAGFDVIGEASDASSALAAVLREAPDVVLLDVVLPDRSGLEVAHCLAAMTPRPLVVLTSSRSRADLGAGLETAAAHGFGPQTYTSRSATPGTSAVSAATGSIRPGPGNQPLAGPRGPISRTTCTLLRRLRESNSATNGAAAMSWTRCSTTTDGRRPGPCSREISFARPSIGVIPTPAPISRTSRRRRRSAVIVPYGPSK